MFSRVLAAAAFAAASLCASAAAAGDDATLVRVFLNDGSSLISYGEPARVSDRVVFSMPTSSGPNPPLHLVNLPLARVDWERTSRYATAARATRYIATQADADYAALSNSVAATLSDVSRTADNAERLTIVEKARAALAEWPQNHYNYRQAEVRQMLSLLDDAIADLQASTGRGRYTLALSAYADPPAIVEPLLPPPTPREAIEQVLAAARVVDTPAERTSLLTAAIGAIDRDKTSVPEQWAVATRHDAAAMLQDELRVDRAYRVFSKYTMTLATARAHAGDVRGVERLLTSVAQRDRLLGRRRPDAVTSLVAAVEERLDAARQLRLARDRFEMRLDVLRAYAVAVRTPLDLFVQLRPSLEAVKALSGSRPASLAVIQETVKRIVDLATAIPPPDEVAAAHALLVSAARLAGNAAQIRREATLAGDMARAWDASSAAAGALMLGARARTDILAQLRPPRAR